MHLSCSHRSKVSCIADLSSDVISVTVNANIIVLTVQWYFSIRTPLYKQDTFICPKCHICVFTTHTSSVLNSEVSSFQRLLVHKHIIPSGGGGGGGGQTDRQVSCL